MKILDIGCGKNKYKSKNPKDVVIGIDCAKLPGVDKVHNLEKFPWPFKDNEFEIIIANHFLEHVSDLIKTLEEIHRICKPGAIIEVKVPYFASAGAFQDPTHKRFFTLRSFEYFDENSGLNYYSKARFNIQNKKLIYFSSRPRISLIFDFFINLSQRVYERFFSRVFPADSLHVKLRVVK